jgi:hypothetical protein
MSAVKKLRKLVRNPRAFVRDSFLLVPFLGPAKPAAGPKASPKNRRALERQKQKDLHFRSLLMSLGQYQTFLDYERSLRGRDMNLVMGLAEGLLASVPGWNAVRLQCAAGLQRDGREAEAAALLVKGMSYVANNDELRNMLIRLCARSRSAETWTFLAGQRIGFSLDVAAAVFGKGIPVPGAFYSACLRRMEEDPDAARRYAEYPADAPSPEPLRGNIAFLLALAQDAPTAEEIVRTAQDLPYDYALAYAVGRRLSRCSAAELASASPLAAPYVAPAARRNFLSLRLNAERFVPAARPSGPGKVAVCISGQARDMAAAHAGIRALIDALGPADVFFATWETNGIRFPLGGTGFSHLRRVLPEAAVDHFERQGWSGQAILERFPSVRAWIDALDGVCEDTVRALYPDALSVEICKDPYENDAYVSAHFNARWIFRRNQLRMYDLVERCVARALDAGSYDCIVRIRPDALIDVRPEALREAVAAAAANPRRIYVDSMIQDAMPSDSFAVGSASAMAWYASLIKMAGHYGDPGFYPAKITPHFILSDHLRLGGIETEESLAVKIRSFASPRIGASELAAMIRNDAAARASETGLDPDDAACPSFV